MEILPWLVRMPIHRTPIDGSGQSLVALVRAGGKFENGVLE
jgi:hypothetical protein